MENLELPEASVLYGDFPFPDGFKRLVKEIDWEQRQIQIYGQIKPLPRLTAWYGDEGRAYTYSGIEHDPKPWNPILVEIRERLTALLEIEFNSVLLNFYRSGQDSIGFHSDDEKELGVRPVIASLSFGGERIFSMRHKQKRYRQVDIPLRDQSLLIMMGDTQLNWRHGIEKTKVDVKPRINLTFRQINY